MPESQAPSSLPGILASIVETKNREVEALRNVAVAVERSAAGAPPVRDFAGALRAGDSVSLIAECKRRSPGAGDIRPDLDPAELTRTYQREGARALSVLTDDSYFGGALGDLAAARESTSLPILRKDFIVDPLQVLEARGAGADAVLLIVRILDDARLRELFDLAGALGLATLVETHDAVEVARALDVGATILGINNRDLATFTTDLDTTVKLLDGVPTGVTVVSESGIRTEADVSRLAEAGVDAILVGETLLKAPDPGVAARALAGVTRGVRREAGGGQGGKGLG